LSDPRVWFGLAVTGFFLWLVLRDAPFGEVARVIARADWLVLVGFSVPAYILVVYLRALRWKQLTATVKPFATGPLFRATAVGFMANNVFPLRMGEVIRSWYLAREAGGSRAAIFGTVILERVIDMVMVIGLAFGVLALLGAGHDGLIARSAVLLLPVAIAPLVVLVLLEAAPNPTIALATHLARPFSTRLAEFLGYTLRRFSEGLGALRSGHRLLWVAFYTVMIWLVASTIPLLAAFAAVGVDFGSAFQTLAAAWMTQAAIGMAVALPSAPGFFGPYHFACKLALERFGIPTESAIALGTLIHAVFWLSLTGLGLAVLRIRRTAFGEIDDAAAGPKTSPER
jgi:uncharacterized protein (TIRG00374 family)